MELRKKVKRPQRYEPELLTRLDPTYVPRSTRPAFHIDYVDFNPALPPAKFPTLQYPNAIEQSEHNLARSSGTETSALGREALTSRQPWASQSQECLDLPYDALDRWEAGDDNGNRGPVGRSQQLQSMRRDHMEERFAEELEVSDEEVESGDRARSEGALRWMDLPVPLQLSIVDAMFTNITLGTVCMQLQLTPLERRKLLRQQWLRGDRRRSEDANIEAMHAEQLRLLLHDQNHGINAGTRSEFCKTLEDHLYKHINVEEDYHTVTKKDLADAQIFLRRIGLDPDLAGEWSEIEDQDLAKESQSVPTSATTNAGPRLKLIMSLPRVDPPQPSAVTGHQTTALTKGFERSTPTMPVKRVLFADKARGPKSMGVAAGPPSELEFASIRVLPPSKHRRTSR